MTHHPPVDELALLALRASGWVPAIALVGAIAASPIARLAPRASARLGQVRRWLGIAAASLAIVHASAALVIYLPVGAWDAITSTAWLRSGAVALALLVPLLITSFPAATRRLRVRAWKPLHRLAYVAIALVIHHLLLAPFAPRGWVLAMAGLVVIALAVRLVPRRGRGRDGTMAEHPLAETGGAGTDS